MLLGASDNWNTRLTRSSRAHDSIQNLVMACVKQSSDSASGFVNFREDVFQLPNSFRLKRYGYRVLKRVQNYETSSDKGIILDSGRFHQYMQRKQPMASMMIGPVAKLVIIHSTIIGLGPEYQFRPAAGLFPWNQPHEATKSQSGPVREPELWHWLQLDLVHFMHISRVEEA